MKVGDECGQIHENAKKHEKHDFFATLIKTQNEKPQGIPRFSFFLKNHKMARKSGTNADKYMKMRKNTKNTTFLQLAEN